MIALPTPYTHAYRKLPDQRVNLLFITILTFMQEFYKTQIN